MKNTTGMPPELQEKVRAAALVYAEEVIGVFERMLRQLATEFSTQAGKATMDIPAIQEDNDDEDGSVRGQEPLPMPTRRGPGRPPKYLAQKIAAERAAGTLTDPDMLLRAKIVTLLMKHRDGLGAEHMNRILGTTTLQISGSLQALVNEGKLQRTGKARGTRYQLVR